MATNTLVKNEPITKQTLVDTWTKSFVVQPPKYTTSGTFSSNGTATNFVTTFEYGGGMTDNSIYVANGTYQLNGTITIDNTLMSMPMVESDVYAPPKVKTVKDVLNHAIRVIEEFGWLQGSIGDFRRGFCSVGALMAVLGGNDRSRLFNEARQALSHELMRQGKGNEIIAYNDARGRKRDQVLDVFRAAAARA